MYNNIGLKTVRGSGTNGYIQTNLAKLPANWKRFRGRRRAFETDEPKKKIYKPSKELVDHNRKRAVEVKVFEYREKLEDQDFAEDDLEEKVASYRKYMLEKMAAGEFDDEAQYLGHNLSMRGNQMTQMEEHVEQEKKNRKMQRALGISTDHKHGAAFDQDLQTKEKNERVSTREAQMTLEDKIKTRSMNYLDRMEGREKPEEEPLHRPGGERERLERGSGGQGVPSGSWRRDRYSYRSRRAFSRSASADGSSRKRARSRSRSRDRKRGRDRRSSPPPSRRPSRRDKDEREPPKKIERWKASDEKGKKSGSEEAGKDYDWDKEVKAKLKSKKKRKKDRKEKEKKKKKKKKRKSGSGGEDGEASSASA